jgi:hypothetical protein
MSNVFILTYSSGEGVKFMKHFKGGASYKIWEPLCIAYTCSNMAHTLINKDKRNFVFNETRMWQNMKSSSLCSFITSSKAPFPSQSSELFH